MHYVYVLLLKNSTSYIGTTSDLTRRYNEHLRGKVRSTRAMNPKLIYYEAYIYKLDSDRRERYLKTGDGRQTLKKQVSILNKVKNERP